MRTDARTQRRAAYLGRAPAPGSAAPLARCKRQNKSWVSRAQPELRAQGQAHTKPLAQGRLPEVLQEAGGTNRRHLLPPRTARRAASPRCLSPLPVSSSSEFLLKKPHASLAAGGVCSGATRVPLNRQAVLCHAGSAQRRAASSGSKGTQDVSSRGDEGSRCPVSPSAGKTGPSPFLQPAGAAFLTQHTPSS